MQLAQTRLPWRRKGEHAKALAALTEAARLHGKPSPLTHDLVALVSLKMGQKEKA